jgi:hypothetical protein
VPAQEPAHGPGHHQPQRHLGPRVGSAGRVKGFGEPHSNRTTP